MDPYNQEDIDSYNDLSDERFYFYSMKSAYGARNSLEEQLRYADDLLLFNKKSQAIEALWELYAKLAIGHSGHISSSFKPESEHWINEVFPAILAKKVFSLWPDSSNAHNYLINLIERNSGYLDYALQIENMDLGATNFLKAFLLMFKNPNKAIVALAHDKSFRYMHGNNNANFYYKSLQTILGVSFCKSAAELYCLDKNTKEAPSAIKIKSI